MRRSAVLLFHGHWSSHTVFQVQINLRIPSRLPHSTLTLLLLLLLLLLPGPTAAASPRTISITVRSGRHAHRIEKIFVEPFTLASNYISISLTLHRAPCRQTSPRTLIISTCFSPTHYPPPSSTLITPNAISIPANHSLVFARVARGCRRPGVPRKSEHLSLSRIPIPDSVSSHLRRVRAACP